MLRHVLALSEDGLLNTIYDFVINLLNTTDILDFSGKLDRLSKVLLFIDFFYSCYGQNGLIFLFLSTFLQLRLCLWVVQSLRLFALFLWRNLILATFDLRFDLWDLEIGYRYTWVFRRENNCRARSWVISSWFRRVCIVCIRNTGLLIENRSPLYLLFKLSDLWFLEAFEMVN